MGVNKPIQIKDIEGLTDKDLVARIAQEQETLRKIEFSHAASSSENPLNIRTKRRDIARMMTHLSSRKKAAVATK